MNKKCFLSLILCLALLLGILPAQAEMVTLGIVLKGMIPQADGSFRETVPEGEFRVFQNGHEIGVIAAGRETLTVSSSDRIRIEPLPESFTPGWDLTTAYLTPDVTGGGVVFIPVTVYPAPETPAAPAETPAPEIPAEIPAEPAGEEAPEAEAPQAEEVPEAAPVQAGPLPTPELPVYTGGPQVTEVPELKGVSGGTGSLKVQVFFDKNGNGSQGNFEDGRPNLTVYLLDADGTFLASAETDAEGFALFTGLPDGSYRTSLTLPEDWYFTPFGGEGSLTENAYDLFAGATQTSRPVEVSAGKTAEQGIGIHNNGCVMSGFCWMDETVDGLYMQGETKLGGIRVRMELEDTDLVYETETDAEGNWKLTNLRMGYYLISVTPPEGMMLTKYTQSRGSRSFLTSDNPRRRILVEKPGTANFGFNWAAQVKGRCYLDANYNGLYDEGELPLGGVKLTALYKYDGATASSTVSGEDGVFLLDALRGNNYSLQAVLPAGGYVFTRTAPEQPLGNLFSARGDQRTATLGNFTIADTERKEMNIGAILPGTVSGTVYYDDDFSASAGENEQKVSGFQVSILDAEGNVAASDRSDAWGNYEITGLAPGEYTLEATAVKGYAFTKKGDGNVMLNRTGGSGYTEAFRVELGDSIRGMNIGMIKPGTVKGTVFADLNDNGVRDEGENGLTGVTVRLMHTEEGEAFRAEIGEDGRFLFDAVMPGQYYVEYTLPEKAVFAQVRAGGNEITAEGTVGTTESFGFVTGEEREAPLCGALTLGRIEGTAFHDPDGDGKMEGEEPLAGMTVKLVPSRSDLEPLTAETGADGAFLLENIRPDTYRLEVSCPEEYVLSRTDTLQLPLKAGRNAQAEALEVRMGAEWNGQLLGAVIPAAISGRIWLDENDNGLFDEGERTPAGYQVTVTDESTGKVFDTPVTDEEGKFSAAGMIPGSFSVSLPLDERTLAAKPGDSAFTEENGALVLPGIRLAEDEKRDGLLMGIIRHTSISGRAWIDRGDALEALPGVEVRMIGSDGTPMAQTVTGGDGSYRFDGLMPCEFTLEVTAPTGCVVIEPGDPRLSGELRSVLTQTSNREGSTEPLQLIMDEDMENMDIGCVLPGQLGDYCWVDLNGDGLQDSSEPGIPNLRIELTRDGRTVAETETNQYGFYRFVDLYPAEYVLKVTMPAEVKPTQRRTDLPMLASVLEEADGDEVFSVPVSVESNKIQYNADLGFVCRVEGVLPEGAGEGEKQVWTPKY